MARTKLKMIELKHLVTFGNYETNFFVFFIKTTHLMPGLFGE